jgi:hypothetical protein
VSGKRLLFGAVGAAFLAGSLLVGSVVAKGNDEQGNLPSKQESSQEGRQVFADTLEMKQSVNVGGINWSLVSYDSSDGPCLDVYANVDPKAAPGQSGCGTPDGPFQWSIGGLDVDGEWYNIAYGTTVKGSVTASIKSSDGTLNLDVIKGSWLSVVPGERMDYASVTLEDGSGKPVASVEFPSISKERQAARDALAKN